jgi:hypothetical protein
VSAAPDSYCHEGGAVEEAECRLWRAVRSEDECETGAFFNGEGSGVKCYDKMLQVSRVAKHATVRHIVPNVA